MIAEPVKKDLTVPQGVTYPVRMRWVDSTNAPITLTGANIFAQIKNHHDDIEPLVSFSLDNNKAFLEPDGWYFGFVISPSDSNALVPTSYVYDLIVITEDGDVTRAMEGRINFTPGVTRVSS